MVSRVQCGDESKDETAPYLMTQLHRALIGYHKRDLLPDFSAVSQ